jgi:hypothetical protein
MTAPSRKTRTVVVCSENRSREPPLPLGRAPVTLIITSKATGLGRVEARSEGATASVAGGTLSVEDDTNSIL